MKWLEYYKGKTVLVTGHTGFKGSWLCVMLEMAGAKVVGYALPPEKDAVLFDCSGAAERMVSVEGDIRDRAHLQEVFHTSAAGRISSGGTADCADKLRAAGIYI